MPLLFVDEYKYLKEYGIRYEFVKVDDDGKTIWKYKKDTRAI